MGTATGVGDTSDFRSQISDPQIALKMRLGNRSVVCQNKPESGILQPETRNLESEIHAIGNRQSTARPSAPGAFKHHHALKYNTLPRRAEEFQANERGEVSFTTAVQLSGTTDTSVASVQPWPRTFFGAT